MIVQDGGAPPRSATGTIYVTVLDENDNAPAFLHVGSGQELTVQVGLQAAAPMGPGGLWMWGAGGTAGEKGVGRGTQESFRVGDEQPRVGSMQQPGLLDKSEMWQEGHVLGQGRNPGAQSRQRLWRALAQSGLASRQKLLAHMCL